MKRTAIEDTLPSADLYCATCERTFHEGQHCPHDGGRLLKLRAPVDPLIGRELDGRYTIIEKLGQGGMGAVYRARQHSVDREVAVKVINANLVASQDVIKRFLREAKLASKLSHPNAVAVLDFGQADDGTFYLVMELVTGKTLDAVFEQHGRFTSERTIKIGMQVCDALEGAQALAIVHRDLKPSNIMVLDNTRDFVKVLDFGLAKSSSPDHTATTMTGAGLVGTPSFMPPELATGRPCDTRSDLYSLGCILYLLASGELPYRATSIHELVSLHGSDDPVPPVRDVPAALAAVIDRMLRKRPEERFQTPAEARAALEGANNGAIVITPYPMRVAPIAGAAPTIVARPAYPRSRRWLPIAAGLIAAGIAATAVAIATGSDHETTDERAPVPRILQPPEPPRVESGAPQITPLHDAGVTAVEDATVAATSAAGTPATSQSIRPKPRPKAQGATKPQGSTKPPQGSTKRPQGSAKPPQGSTKPPQGSGSETPF